MKTKNDILGGTLKENLKRITESYHQRNGIIEQQPIGRIREADDSQYTARIEKFLRDFNDSGFADWYSLYDEYISGDLEEGDPRWDAFLDETDDIIRFLGNIIK